MEDDSGCGDGHNFFEYATDAERDHRCSPKQRKFRRRHQKGQQSREEEYSDSQKSTLFGGKHAKTLAERVKSFDRDCDDSKSKKHDGSQEEDAAERITRCRIPQEKDLCQGPAETRKKGGADNQYKAKSIERRLSCDHHYDANSHGSDDENKLDGRGLEAEDEGKKQNKS